jgi:hypothetical protein
MAVRWLSTAIVFSLACSSALAVTASKHKPKSTAHKTSTAKTAASSSAHRVSNNAQAAGSGGRLRAASYATTGQSTSSKSPATKTSSSKKRKASKSKHVRREPIQMAPTSDRISEVQTALGRGGYYKTDPNGKWDADSVDALQRFQSANGLDTTGKLDALTLQKLGLGSDVAGVSAPKGITPHSCCSMTPSPSFAPPPAPAPSSLKQTPPAPPPPVDSLSSSTSSTQP